MKMYAPAAATIEQHAQDGIVDAVLLLPTASRGNVALPFWRLSIVILLSEAINMPSRKPRVSLALWALLLPQAVLVQSSMLISKLAL
jgi:hypothetical protein